MHRKIILAGIVGVALLTALPVSAHTQFDWRSHLKRSQCDAVGAPIINAIEKVKNDADSGTAGNYWAFDNYVRKIKVWRTSTVGVYCASVSYDGGFKAVAGQTSPGNTGTLSGKEKGSMDGGYQATITGTLLSNPTWNKFGSVGVVDYQCDINGNCPGRVDWVAQYFNSDYSFDFNWWGWIYRGGKFGTWINSVDGNSGDII